jgi:hypothetical protein
MARYFPDFCSARTKMYARECSYVFGFYEEIEAWLEKEPRAGRSFQADAIATEPYAAQTP